MTSLIGVFGFPMFGNIFRPVQMLLQHPHGLICERVDVLALCSMGDLSGILDGVFMCAYSDIVNIAPIEFGASFLLKVGQYVSKFIIKLSRQLDRVRAGQALKITCDFFVVYQHLLGILLHAWFARALQRQLARLDFQHARLGYAVQKLNILFV